MAKKLIRIFALPSHQTRERTSGVDFARIIQPLKHLDGFKIDGYKFKVDLYDIFKQEQTNWLDVGENYDLVYFNYTVIDWAYAAMAALTRGRNPNFKLILDVDDAIWNINKDNIAYDALKKVDGGYILSQIIKDVDAVSTTNSYLRNVICDKAGIRHDKVSIFPNMIDLKHYDHISPFKNENTITLFHYGSTSHFDDLMRDDFVKGIDMVFMNYPNVVFKAIGANIPRLKLKWGERYTYGWGHSDIYHWIDEKFPVFMDEADIMVVPLQDNLYNRCKSDIKFIETATTKTPGVFSRIRPYQEFIEDGKTAFLADKSEEWYEKIKTLIDDVDRRKRMGEDAYKYVVKNRQIDKIVSDYARFIIKTLNS